MWFYGALLQWSLAARLSVGALPVGWRQWHPPVPPVPAVPLKGPRFHGVPLTCCTGSSCRTPGAKPERERTGEGSLKGRPSSCLSFCVPRAGCPQRKGSHFPSGPLPSLQGFLVPLPSAHGCLWASGRGEEHSGCETVLNLFLQSVVVSFPKDLPF